LHSNDLMKKHSIEHGDGAGQLCPLQGRQQLGLVIRLPLHTLQQQQQLFSGLRIRIHFIRIRIQLLG